MRVVCEAERCAIELVVRRYEVQHESCLSKKWRCNAYGKQRTVYVSLRRVSAGFGLSRQSMQVKYMGPAEGLEF